MRSTSKLARRLLVVVAATGTSVATQAPVIRADNVLTVDSTEMVGGNCAVVHQCTLPAALAATTAGGSIILPAGTFTVSGAALTVPAGAAVTITGAGAGATVIHGDGTSRLLEASGGSLLLSGLTLSGGFSVHDGGGAVFATSTALTLSGVTVSGNGADSDGGAIGLVHGALVVDHSTLSANNGQNGGAVFAAGAPVTITGSTFDANGASQGAGAVFASYPGGFHVTGSTFTSNGATVDGGAIVLEGAGEPGPADTIAGSTFTNNDAAHLGGAVYVKTATVTTAAGLTIDGTTFTGNSAEAGGALAIEDPPVTITGSTFTGNSAAADGGAIAAAAEVTIGGSHFTGNHSGGSGGAISTRDLLTVTGTTFDANHAEGSGGVFELIGPAPSIDATFTNNTAYASGAIVLWTGSAELHLPGIADADINAPVVVHDNPLVPLVPARLLETRTGAGLGTVDGQFDQLGVRDVGTVTALTVTGRGGVARDASSVVLNVAVVDARAPGFVTVYPCGSTRPNAANANYVAGTTVSDAVLAQVGTNGQVCIYTLGPIDLAVDVTGYFPAGSAYSSLMPSRLLETRTGAGLGTVDGQFNGIGALDAGSTTAVTVTGRAGTPADSSAVVLNVAVIDARGPGFVTVYPCGTPRPNAANVNYVAGATISDAVVAQIGTNGQVCIYTHASIDLAVDVSGSFPSGSTYAPLPPARVLETRTGPGLGTVDGQFSGIGSLAAGSVTPLTVSGRGGTTTGSNAVVLNVAVIDARGPGFVTVYPCGSPRPNAANVNYIAGSTISNAVLATIGTNGQVCIFTYAAVDLAVDIDGSSPTGAG